MAVTTRNGLPSIYFNEEELSSLAVKSLVCKEADKYAGLPILWLGQEVGEIGPIEPLPEHVRQEPYSLPEGFHWVPLSNIDVDKLVKFVQRNDDNVKNVDNDHFMQHIKYYTTYPIVTLDVNGNLVFKQLVVSW